MPDFPDAEAVLLDLLGDLGYTCTALPDDQVMQVEMPIIVCNRIGGGTNDNITDRALCAVLVIHQTRPLAWATAALVRARILEAGNVPTAVNGILIDSTSEADGNQEVIDLDPDVRMVDATFWLSFRRPLR